jgi:D-tyrosyl-tRNA(Tyr) deacylase
VAGFGPDDGPDLPGSKLWDKALEKLLDLRIFPDEDGKLNVGLRDFGGGLIMTGGESRRTGGRLGQNQMSRNTARCRQKERT